MSFAYNTPIQYIPGIGSRTAKILHQYGIHTAGELNRMPEQVLVELFGPSIRRVLSTLHMPIQSVRRAPVVMTHAPVKRRFGQRLRMAAQVLAH